MYESTTEAVGKQNALFKKVQDLRLEEDKKANDLHEKYQDEQVLMIQNVHSRTDAEPNCHSESPGWARLVCPRLNHHHALEQNLIYNSLFSESSEQ